MFKKFEAKKLEKEIEKFRISRFSLKKKKKELIYKKSEQLELKITIKFDYERSQGNYIIEEII